MLSRTARLDRGELKYAPIPPDDPWLLIVGWAFVIMFVCLYCGLP